MVLYTTGFVNLLSLGGGDLGSLLCEFSRPPVLGGEPARPVLGRRPGCWGSGSQTRLQESPHTGPRETPRSSSGADARVGTPRARRSPSGAVPACPPLGPAVLQSCGGEGRAWGGVWGESRSSKQQHGPKAAAPREVGHHLGTFWVSYSSDPTGGEHRTHTCSGGTVPGGGAAPTGSWCIRGDRSGDRASHGRDTGPGGGGGDRSALCPPAQRPFSSSYSSWRGYSA